LQHFSERRGSTGEFSPDFLTEGRQASGSECGFDLVFGFRFFRQKREFANRPFYHLALQLDFLLNAEFLERTRKISGRSRRASVVRSSSRAIPG